jgi:hypothetical protein
MPPLFRVKVLLGRVSPRLSRYTGSEPLSVEQGQTVNAAFARKQTLKNRGCAQAERRNRACSGDNDSSFHMLMAPNMSGYAGGF